MREIVYTEKLNSIRNEMTHLWTSFFIVGGGSFTLLFNKPTFGVAGLAFIGLLFACIFFNAYIVRRTELLKLLNKLERENK